MLAYGPLAAAGGRRNLFVTAPLEELQRDLPFRGRELPRLELPPEALPGRATSPYWRQGALGSGFG